MGKTTQPIKLKVLNFPRGGHPEQNSASFSGLLRAVRLDTPNAPDALRRAVESIADAYPVSRGDRMDSVQSDICRVVGEAIWAGALTSEMKLRSFVQVLLRMQLSR